MKSTNKTRPSVRRANRRTAVSELVRPRSGGAPARPLDAADIERLRRLASLATLLAAGYAACADHAKDSVVALEASRLSQSRRSIADDVGILLASEQVAPAKTMTGRLRWEWLASTGRLFGGTPERKIIEECLRLESDAAPLTEALERGRGGRLRAGEGPSPAASLGRIALRMANGHRAALGLASRPPGAGRLAHA